MRIKKGLARVKPQKFKTRLLLQISSCLLAGIILTLLIVALSINNLKENASEEAGKGLLEAKQKYLQDYMAVTAERVNGIMNNIEREVTIMAAFAQYLEDNKEQLSPLFDSLAQVSLLNPNLQYDAAKGWYQTPPGSTSVVSIMPYLLDQNNQIKPEVKAAVRQSALLDLLFPIMQKYGSENIRLNYFGPPELAYVRSVPWSDYAGGYARNNPQNYAKTNIWNYLPPSILQSWQSWASHPDLRQKLTSEVTFSRPYIDSAGRGLLMTVFHPIWDKERKKVSGSVSLNLSLNQIVGLVENLDMSNSGFGFLSQADGNVLALNSAKEPILGVTSKVETLGGFQGLSRYIQFSTQPDFANLDLPTDNKLSSLELQSQGKVQLVLLQNLTPINFLGNPTKPIATEAWTLGFVVPRDEILAPLIATRKSISDNSQRVLILTLVATLLTSLAVIALIYWLAGRMTLALSKLNNGAKELEASHYDVQLEVNTNDEFGQLGLAFNAMAHKIREHTHNLEELVSRRTVELKAANQQINYLNERLKADNVRMSAELDVTRQLQQLILPKEHELKSIVGLEIAGFMEPADEVGGDYYDVIEQDGQVKIGIGDVTGHGLESGVVMLMVQTAVRALLLDNQGDLKHHLNQINRTIYDNVQRMSSEKNMSLSLLEYQDGNLIMSGQHEQLILVRQNGQLELIDTLELGFPIGLEPDIMAFIGEYELRLLPGDAVVLYTDGIPEAENSSGLHYGLERFCQIVTQAHTESASNIIQAVIADLKNFIGGQKVFDDITLVVLKQKELVALG